MSNRLNELKSLSPEQMLARAGEILPPWVVLILVLAVAWQLVRITWLLFPQGSASLVMPADTPRLEPAPAQGSYDLARIEKANLFGARAPDEELLFPDDDFGELDDTQLNLTLRGTIAASGDQVALAIIADDRGEETVYAIGDPISGGRKLHSVQPDQAILNHNGELEALRLPREYESESASTARSNTRSRRPSPVRPSSRNSQLQSLASNPSKLTDLIRPQPVFSDGKQLGYRVYPGRRRQQFVALGLKPGDLVTEINGSPLNDPARGAEIFKSLAESNQVTVTVERNGSPQVLVLDTDKLNELQNEQKQ